MSFWNRPVTHPHGKRARTVREGAFVFEKVEVHLADVVLQVKRCGEVGLTVLPGANQHRLLGGVDPLVPTQQIHLLEHLLACPARKRGCTEENIFRHASFSSDRNTHTWMFGHVLLKLPPGVCKNWAVGERAAVTCVDTATRSSNERTHTA